MRNKIWLYVSIALTIMSLWLLATEGGYNVILVAINIGLIFYWGRKVIKEI